MKREVPTLIREAALAAEWEIDLDQFRLLRRRHGWACTKFSRQDIRYTPEQVQMIVLQLATSRAPKQADNGQTARSIARAS